MLIICTKYLVNRMNGVKSKGKAPIDLPLMPSSNFFLPYMPSRVKYNSYLLSNNNNNTTVVKWKNNRKAATIDERKYIYCYITITKLDLLIVRF